MTKDQNSAGLSFPVRYDTEVSSCVVDAKNRLVAAPGQAKGLGDLIANLLNSHHASLTDADIEARAERLQADLSAEAIESAPLEQLALFRQGAAAAEKVKLASLARSRDLIRTALAEVAGRVDKPLDVVLFCPNCKMQHVDAAEPDKCEDCGHKKLDHDLTVSHGFCCAEPGCTCTAFTAWLNPPHKSHRCHGCNTVWRPADFPTNGILAPETKGSNDTPTPYPLAEVRGEGWVPVSERLPDASGQYDVTVKDNVNFDDDFVLLTHYQDGYGWGLNESTYPVIAWRNRPTPYSQEISE